MLIYKVVVVCGNIVLTTVIWREFAPGVLPTH